MKRVARHLLLRLFALVACASIALAAGTAAAQHSGPRFERPALDSMLAPIALYPDALLSHVLMAATYPEEIAEAASWLRARPGLSGDAAVRTSADQDWDPSVRSLLAFPLVLDTMANHLRWAEDLGNAFLYQRAEVMDTVQALRRRAYEAGTLRSNEAVRVVIAGDGIVIEQASAETVHIPHYDPRVAYGGWWWPSRPPVHWPRWHGYVDPLPRGHHLTWGPGIHIGSGFFFGGFVWPRREVRVVHVHPHYYPRRVVVERRVVPGHRDPVVVHRDARPGVWRHDDWRRHRDRNRDGDHDRRRDWRRDDDRRGPATTRSVIESREARRDDVRDRRGTDRDGDGVPDRARRVDRNNDGVPDRARRVDRDNDGVPDRARRVPDRDGDGRPDWNRGSIDRDRDGIPDRGSRAADLRRNDRSENREQSRTQRPDRDEARSRNVREAPRAAERTERGAPPSRNAEPEREFRRPPRARVDPSNRD